VDDVSSDCLYRVPSVGAFTKHVVYTFNGNTIPSGLNVDTDFIPDQNNYAPYNHIFLASNVAVQDNYLQIKVPGGQTPSTAPRNAITSGEVSTVEPNILYASVRTRAIFGDEPGTCSGSFFYKGDTQEIDLEFLSDPKSTANPHSQSAIHLTNQPTHGGQSSTTSAAYNSFGTEREFRIDWTPRSTAFYIDGHLERQLFDNIPSSPGKWLWNNWSNGNLAWSAGPPVRDNIMKISSIEMYYNTTDSAHQVCT